MSQRRLNLAPCPIPCGVGRTYRRRSARLRCPACSASAPEQRSAALISRLLRLTVRRPFGKQLSADFALVFGSKKRERLRSPRSKQSFSQSNTYRNWPCLAQAETMAACKQAPYWSARQGVSACRPAGCKRSAQGSRRHHQRPKPGYSAAFERTSQADTRSARFRGPLSETPHACRRH